MNRIDRLSAILIQLQSRPLVKAQDLAEKFAISLRTVYRDIRALEEAGVPVIGEAGTGYRLMEGYKLPPIMFNQDEASALLTAAKLMQSMSDKPSSKHYGSALDKIKAVLRMSEKEHISEIDQHIAVVTHPAFVYQKPEELHLQKLLKAIASFRAIRFEYSSIGKGETLQRKAEPVGIYYQGSHWYLVAFCLLRNDYRNFRTDRIANLVITDEKITQSHPPLQDFINKMADKREVHKVVIEVERDIVKYLGDQKYYSGFVKEEPAGDYIQMTFLTGSLTGFARWFMLFGDRASILEPLELNDVIADIARSILKKVQKRLTLLT
ncbi:YafY family transcriptional regulator [Chitinophagaceae bacterium LB-8]|uniref:YafY family transcriptional regulator n=1 Tax=Paraflavisolibacter caeni TaxID=2982496 RepID=A0A9X2XZX1_9BACT|nr:YafY family protein [Paraflavisolibacter caeni]MCU7552016.1 YafY family transcriptional regulator [Paraflavisolibacter caeni]